MVYLILSFVAFVWFLLYYYRWKRRRRDHWDAITEAQQKGRQFECFVVERFSENYFDLKVWQGDKYYKGKYADANHNPDLELEYNCSETRYIPFAVECKWRRCFNEHGSIRWATEEQIRHYNEYSDDRNIQVFVVIGIGGDPSEPDEVYIVPLEKLKYPYVKKDYLQRFRRKKPAAFFYFDQADGRLL